MLGTDSKLQLHAEGQRSLVGNGHLMPQAKPDSHYQGGMRFGKFFVDHVPGIGQYVSQPAFRHLGARILAAEKSSEYGIGRRINKAALDVTPDVVRGLAPDIGREVSGRS
jgi:hypothetical protein